MFRRRYTSRQRGLGGHRNECEFVQTDTDNSSINSNDIPSMPIRLAPKNRDLKIVALLGATNFVRRLAELGLGLGSIIQIVQAHGFGPVIIDVAGSRIALGHGMTDKILVKLA